MLDTCIIGCASRVQFTPGKRSRMIALMLLSASFIAQGCASLTGAPERVVMVPRPEPAPPRPQPLKKKKPELKTPGAVQTGEASWYGPGFVGKKTASGEIFNDDELTAAHLEIPLGSRVRVTNLENGKSVEVKINDRGPYRKGRVIDLSRAAARALGMIEDGVVNVRVEVIALADAEQASR